MKIAIVNTCTPYIYGGAEFLVDTLLAKFRAHGHQATLVRVPFPRTLDGELLKLAIAVRTLDLSAYDLVLAHKFPTYCVSHPNRRLWLFHQLRQVYDLWGTEYGFTDTAESRAFRDIIRQVDNRYLPESRKIYTNSRETTNRLSTYNGIASEVLYPPLLDADKFYCEGYGDYIFYPSRVTGLKRQDLAIQALAHAKSNVRLLIAGKVESDEYRERLQELIRSAGLEQRVKLLGVVSQEEKFRLMAGALACFYIPYREDSYGFVSLEAFYARKCVITCTDSGGTDELIDHERNGFILPPDPRTLGECIDRLAEDRSFAERLGQNAFSKVLRMNLTWDRTVEKLIS